MTPTKAIQTTDEMLGQFNRLVAAIRVECEQIADEWYSLGQHGGQREDHAATLLSRLRPALDELSKTSARCSEQITEMVADPFNQKGANNE